MSITAIHADPTVTRSDSPARTALNDVAPFALALVPFGLAVGAASAAAHLSAVTALFGATALLAGAAQLAAVEMVGSGGGIGSVVLVTALVNLRFVLYGAGVAAWFDGLPLRRRLLLAFPIVDQTFMLCQQRFEHEHDPTWRQRYYLTATAMLAGTFVGSQATAYQLGSTLPDGLGLHLAAPLAFAGMLANSLRGRSTVVAGAMSAMIMVGTAGLFGPAALPLGVITGVTAGVLATRKSHNSPPADEPATNERVAS